jgi:hypothetical protein
MGEHIRPGRAHGVLRSRQRVGDQLPRFQTVVDPTGCVTGMDLTNDPKVTLTLTMTDLLRLATASAGLLRLVGTRRLSIHGDLRFAVALARRLDIPGRQ